MRSDSADSNGPTPRTGRASAGRAEFDAEADAISGQGAGTTPNSTTNHKSPIAIPSNPSMGIEKANKGRG